MSEKIDVLYVSIKSFPPDGNVNPQNAGIWHNYYLYEGYKTPQDLDWSDDYSIWCDLLITMADKNENAGNLPTGSVAYVSKISEAIKHTNSKDFQPTIDKLKLIFDELKNDVNYNKTSLMAVSSIAYYSSIFWSEVKEVENGVSFSLRWPRWVIKLCKDIAGALAGGASGLAVGTFIGGPVGSVVGLGLGIAAGAVGGSAIS